MAMAGILSVEIKLLAVTIWIAFRITAVSSPRPEAWRMADSALSITVCGNAKSGPSDLSLSEGLWTFPFPALTTLLFLGIWPQEAFAGSADNPAVSIQANERVVSFNLRIVIVSTYSHSLKNKCLYNQTRFGKRGLLSLLNRVLYKYYKRLNRNVIPLGLFLLSLFSIPAALFAQFPVKFSLGSL